MNNTFICGNTFVNLADYIFTPTDKLEDDYYNFATTLDINKLNDGDIVYTHTVNCKLLFDILKQTDKQVKVISHNSDHNVDFNDYQAMPNNIIKWYSTNVCYAGDKLESIPIGIENPQRISFHHLDKPSMLSNKLLEPTSHRNWLYICHTTWTNKKERELPYLLLGNKSWVTAKQSQIFNFSDYIDNIYNHHFVLCPAGNGEDTHRTWETLYLGSIPIVKKTINNLFYQDLPICFVNDWEEITEDFLEDEYNRITCRNDWNMVKLAEEYWRNIIYE